jgi:ketosteroid isomerase-like protein
MSEQNISIVRQGYEAFGRGDIQALLNLLAEDVEWTSSGPTDLPTAGTRRGRQQVAEFFTAVNELFTFERFEPKTFIAEGERVVVLGEDRFQLKATGKVLDEAWAHVFTIRGGRIVGFYEYIDTAEVMAELRAAHARA